MAKLIREGEIIRTFIACALLRFSAPALSQPTHQLPTATELFNLRGRCAQLGEKIMRETPMGERARQLQKSRYDARTSRRFVELTVLSDGYFALQLFDGQTQEMLAALHIKRGTKEGVAFDRGQKSPSSSFSLTSAGFDEASDYINKMMSD